MKQKKGHEDCLPTIHKGEAFILVYKKVREDSTERKGLIRYIAIKISPSEIKQLKKSDGFRGIYLDRIQHLIKDTLEV